MKRIPVTRDFDATKPIGYLMLGDDVEITPDSVLAFAYTLLAGTLENPTKIDVHEITLTYNPTPVYPADSEK